MAAAAMERLVASEAEAAGAFSWPPGRPFLTAEWRQLVMLNYAIDPAVVAPLVPAGCELDFFDGRTFVSLVGFLFRRTRLFGVRVPLHDQFEELNLRFYVRRDVDGEVRRGVAFIRELVPRRAVALVARLLYGENYLATPMSHRLDGAVGDEAPPARVEYRWRFAGEEHRLAIATAGAAEPLVAGSHEEFIAEHYWGYTALPRGGAREYQVAHPPWRIAPATSVEVAADVATIYGPAFASYLAAPPVSAFWAAGSPVRVYPGRRLTRLRNNA